MLERYETVEDGTAVEGGSQMPRETGPLGPARRRITMEDHCTVTDVRSRVGRPDDSTVAGEPNQICEVS